MSFVTGKKVYLQNLSSSYLPYFAQIVITIIITPMLVNIFGQERYGVYVLLNTFIAYFTLSNIGLPQTLIREIIHAREEENHSKINQMISSIFFYYSFAIVGVFLVNILFFYIDIFNLNTKILSTQNISLIQSFSLGVLLVSLLFGMRLITEIFDAIIKATNKIYITQIVKFINVVLLGVSTFAALKLYGSIEAVLIANALASFLVLFILISQSKKLIEFQIEFKNSSYKVFKEMLPSSFWYFMSGIGVLLIFQTDSIVISSITGLSSVAVYSLMFKFSDIFRQILSNIVNVMFSDVSRLYAKKKFDLIVKRHNQLLGYTIILTLIASLFLYFVGYKLFQFWIGVENSGTIELFLFFIIYMALFSINQVSGLFLGAMNKHKNGVIVGFIQAGLNLILSISLLYVFQDVKWVIISTILALLVTNLWYSPYYFYKEVKLENSNS
jgi:O-antigen/teichoic acid export membrane protein